MQESEDSVLGEKERRVNFMDVPMSWMKEYAPVTADIKDFIEDITLSGSKVEGYTTVAGEIKNVVTGYIKEIVKHPDADKLHVTTVDLGDDHSCESSPDRFRLFECLDFQPDVGQNSGGLLGVEVGFDILFEPVE